MLIRDISKRILIYDDYKQAKSIEQSCLEDGTVQGVQIEQIDLNRWKVEIIYAVGDYYKSNTKYNNEMIKSGRGLPKL